MSKIGHSIYIYIYNANSLQYLKSKFINISIIVLLLLHCYYLFNSICYFYLLFLYYIIYLYDMSIYHLSNSNNLYEDISEKKTFFSLK